MWKVLITTVAKQGDVLTRDLWPCISSFFFFLLFFLMGQSLNVLVDVVLTHG